MSSINLQVLRSKVENIATLPTVPSVLKRLSMIIEKPTLSLDEISHFVSSDPALTVKILKMVNSAIYGFPGKISSVSHAIMLLGLNVVKGLLLGVSVFELMQKSMFGLREHSIGCAIAARIIAGRKGLKEAEEVSVAALLHDIGKVVLMLSYPNEYQAAMNDAAAKNQIIVEQERQYFTESHAAVGMWLAEKWRFPRNLVEVIEFHHKPNLSKAAFMETAIVHFSDILVRARGIGFAGDHFVPTVNPTAFEVLELDAGDIKDILRELEDSLVTAGEDFLGE
jgi:putative nucleotidyltransferase with HDIG domain